MREPLSTVSKLVKDAITTETMSIAGRINMLGMTMVFVLLAAGSTLDVVQAIVRILRPNFTAGDPPLLLLAVTMSALTLCCIVVVSIVDPLSHSRSRDRGDEAGRVALGPSSIRLRLRRGRRRLYR